MALFFTTLLIIAIVGMSSLLYLKHWELTTGRLALGSVRPRANHFLRVGLFWLETVLPTLARVYARRGARALMHTLHVASAWIVLKIEQVLERALHMLRHTTDARHLPTTQASAFLREVAEHKRKLLRMQDAMHLHEE